MTTKLLKNLAAAMLLLAVQDAWAQRYNQLITNPPLLKSASGNFTITAHDSSHNFYPSQTTPSAIGGDTLLFNKPIPTMAYNQATYLGPTMVWQGGQMLNLSSVNRINGQSTTIHWHGLNLPAHLDGGPQEPIEKNGGTFNTSFNVIDPTQTCWYHSHLMDSTTYQVIKGLAGMILVEQPTDPLISMLPHHYDTNDFPIVIQDKGFTFGPKTGNVCVVNGLDTAGGGSIHTPGNGPYTLVNGVLNGYLKVPKGLVRLRLLNGSYRKTFQVVVGNKYNTPTAYEPLYLIATDGGFTAIPHAIDSIIIGPGERYEILIDFSLKNNSDTVYLNNRSSSLPAAGPPGTTTPGYVTGGFINKNAFMAFVVDTSIHPATPGIKPVTLKPYAIDTTNVSYRLKVLGNDSTIGGKIGTWTINGDTMNMDSINDIIQVNSKEIWSIKNTTNVYHPFHIHKVQFQVIDMRYTTGAIVYNSFYNGTLPKNWLGYKDDVLVPPYRTVRFVASFDSFPSPEINPMYAFMYHCHILTHEDNSMMQQFVVVDTVQIKAGIRKLSQKGNFILYPNPAGDVLNLKGSSTSAGTLRITDILGRTLREEKVMPFNGILPVNIADLPRGMVFVEWNSGNTHFIQKILLK